MIATRIAAMSGLLLLAGCASAVREQIYKADATPVAIAQWTRSPPQDISVRTQDGLMLKGYYWPGDPADEDVVIFFHGRGSTQGVGAKYAEYLTGHGDHVIVASYRGFGGNPGSPTQAGLVADGRAFVSRARSIVGPGAHIFLIGHSLGGAVALHVAATVPVTGVVTLSTFDKLAESAPDHLSLLLPDKWNNVDAAGKINVPLVMLYGSADERVEAEQADTLFAAAQAPATLLTVPGATHNPQMDRLGPIVTQAVASVDAGTLAMFPDPLPTGWSVRRK